MITDRGDSLYALMSYYVPYMEGVIDACIKHEVWESSATYRCDIESILMDLARDAFAVGLVQFGREKERGEVLGPGRA